jgi:hypothetical protein
VIGDPLENALCAQSRRMKEELKEIAECGIRGREYKREHRDPASNIQRRSGCVLSFSGDSGRPSKSEGRNKKEERQPPLRAKVGATLVPGNSQN